MGDKILTSDDNFIAPKESNILEGYSLITSRNKISEISLKYFYKKKKANQILQELKYINKLLNKEKIVDDGYGHAFEVFAMAIYFDLTYQQVIDNYLINGKSDGKIDAIYWNNNLVYIFQIKMNDRPQASELDIAKNNYNNFFNELPLSNNSEDLKIFLEKHKFDLEGKDLRIYTISKDKTDRNNISSTEIFNKFFQIKLLPQKLSKIKLKIKFENIIDDQTTYTIRNFAKTKNNIFLFVNAQEIINELKAQGINKDSDKLYFENVRGILGENVGMQRTIIEAPDKFELYNNGVSILGEIQNSSTHIILNNPTIINGQQTLYNLMLAEERGIDISKITVPVFIKDENKRSERLNIARYNNTQRQIKDIDLLSINANLRDVQEYLLIKSIEKNFLDDCFYLQIISSGKRDSNQTIKSLFEKNNIIKLTDFIRIYWVTYNNTLLGSWKNNISIMIRNEIIDKNYCFELSKSEKNMQKYFCLL